MRGRYARGNAAMRMFHCPSPEHKDKNPSAQVGSDGDWFCFACKRSGNLNKPPSVQGKRSPRWAVWTKMTIPCKNGEDYLIRRRIIQTPLFGVYVHDLLNSDPEDPHDHPWNFISIILRGGYLEHLHVRPHENISLYVKRRWLTGSIHKMSTDKAHRIVSVEPGTLSLIIVGPRKRNWGFFPAEGGWVPWNEYEAEHRGPARGAGSSVP